MARFLKSLALFLLIIAIVGFWRGWFIAHTDNSNSQSNLNVTVNKEAIRQDESAVQNEAHTAGETIKDKISPPTSAPSQSPVLSP